MADDEGKDQCIFCHIVAGAVASKKVYEDDKVVAVLDINPANPGHVLLMPKVHHAFMPHCPDDLASYMGMIAKQLSFSMLRAFKAGGTSIFVGNGVVAGQRAPHMMMHVIPRMDADGLSGLSLPAGSLSPEQLLGVRKALEPGVKNLLGYEPAAAVVSVPVQAAKPAVSQVAQPVVRSGPSPASLSVPSSPSVPVAPQPHVAPQPQMPKFVPKDMDLNTISSMLLGSSDVSSKKKKSDKPAEKKPAEEKSSAQDASAHVGEASAGVDATGESASDESDSEEKLSLSDLAEMFTK